MLSSEYQISRSKIIGVILLTVFLSVSVIGLFHVSSSMDMGGHTSDCLFISQTETLCSMSVLGHIVAWKSALLATMPTWLFSLVMVAIVLAFLPTRLQTRRYRVLLNLRTIIERVYSFVYRPWQELFSSGILNPKLY